MRAGIDDVDVRMVPFADRFSRYDLVLLAIPLAFVAALLVSAVVDLPPRTALVAASIVGAAAIADGMFRDPPRPRAAGQSRHASAAVNSD